jgi:hypothetical protein
MEVELRIEYLTQRRTPAIHRILLSLLVFFVGLFVADVERLRVRSHNHQMSPQPPLHDSDSEDDEDYVPPADAGK